MSRSFFEDAFIGTLPRILLLPPEMLTSMTSDLPPDPLSELDDEPTSTTSAVRARRASRRVVSSELDDDSDADSDDEALDDEGLLDLDEPDAETAAPPKPSRAKPAAKGAATKSSTRGKSKKAAADEDLDEIGPTTERLQKVLASAGLASRRHCEEYILEGRVTVDGKTVRVLGIKVDPETQNVCVDGERVKIERKRHYLVHKPTGVHCTNADPLGRVRVIDLLPESLGRLFTVGRLDEGSEGLILVTNDGALAHRLDHPKFQVQRLYRCLVAGTPSDEVLRQLRDGMYFTEGKFRVRDIRRIKTNGKSTILEVVLTEGQNREVRRLFARVGHKVMRLKRIGFGPMRLGDLPIGAYRPLTPVELKVLTHFATSAPTRRSPARARPIRNATSASRATKPVTRGHASSRGPKAAVKRSPNPNKRPRKNRG